MAFIIYTVKGDMRWDAVSWACYGVPGLASGIIAANPDVPIELFVPTGTRLQVPILLTTAAPVSSELLPPWKR